MNLNRRSIRIRAFFLVLIPLLSLIGLYAFATTITARNAITLARATTVRNSIADPIGFLATEVQGERLLATVYLAAPTARDRAALTAQQAKTNESLGLFRTAANSAATQKASSAGVKAALAATFRQVAGLPALRAKIVAGTISPAAAQQAYSDMISAGYHSINQAILQQPNVPLVNQSLAVLRIAEAEEILLRAQSLAVGDDMTGNFPAADHAQFARLVGQYQGLLNEARPDLTPAYRVAFDHAVSPTAIATLTTLENEVINSRAGAVPRVSLTAYDQAARAVASGLAAAGFAAGGTLASSLHQAARPIDMQLIIAGGAGLLAIIVSVIVSIWIGRGLVRQLAELRQGALELAHQRLPQVMARLSAGEEVDIDAEAPPLATSPDEIGQVRQAFNSVQRSAIEAAVGQARLRAGVSTAFRNLARRSQSLLHQQLAVLDDLERRATEPSELEGLFRVDHLTTRMRRHAEGLVVLAGDQPGRGWTDPVPMADVLRGAVAEVVDYSRIRVVCTSRAALAGRAVADTIHMIAELAENATVFSPPDAPVRIVGSLVVRGFAVEIEDRGLGMPDEMMDEFNAAFLNPPPLDLAESEQLGLYVAARLAHRHDIRITLRSSPFGGTSAIVLIPLESIVASGTDGRPQPANPANGHPRSALTALTGRHASRSNGSGPPATSTWIGPGNDTNGHVVTSNLNGSAVNGSALNGSALNGSAVNGSALNGSAVNGSALNGSAPNGSALNGDLAGPAEQQGAETMAAPLPEIREMPGWVTKSGAGPGVGRPDQPESAESDGSGLADFELPRRTRHTHLAPQLREPATPDAGNTSDELSGERSPDMIRDALTKMQRGWERGRDEGPQAGAGDPARGTPDPIAGGDGQHSDEPPDDGGEGPRPGPGRPGR